MSLTPGSFVLIFLLLPLTSSDSSIHDLLRSHGLPSGLFPDSVKSYKFDQTGCLEVHLDRPCLAEYENRVYFESVVRANLSYGQLKGLEGLSQEELFLWLPVKDIIVKDPSSGVILFDIGLAHKQLSLSLFEDPPICRSQEIALKRIGLQLRSLPKFPGWHKSRSSVLLNMDGRRSNGFQDQQ